MKLMTMIRNEFRIKSEIELLTQAEQRLLLVTKARWILTSLLLIYGSFITLLYASNSSVNRVAESSIYSFIILGIVMVYNAFYHIAWHNYPRIWVTRIKFFIALQLIIDSLMITLLVHYTGGVTSWFWTLYVLLTLELTYLIPTQKEALFLGATYLFSYTSLLFLEYFEIISRTKMPFTPNSLQTNLPYVLIVWFWVCLLNTSVAIISMYLHSKERESVKQKIIRDSLTNLYNRRFFNHSINSEIERAKRFSRSVSLLMIDLDDFKKYNDTFGHVEGDNLLRTIAKVLGVNLRRSEKEPTYDIDIACRYGGEEFAIILPETSTKVSYKKAQALVDEIKNSGAIILAEKLRTQVEKTKMLGRGITISIGVATFPLNARNSKELIISADKALYRAKSLGKNRVEVSSDQIIKNAG